MKEKIEASLNGAIGGTNADDKTAGQSDFFADQMGTSHVSVIDKNDLMVAATQ